MQIFKKLFHFKQRIQVLQTACCKLLTYEVVAHDFLWFRHIMAIE